MYSGAKGHGPFGRPTPSPDALPLHSTCDKKYRGHGTPMNELSEQDVTVDACSRKRQTHCSSRDCKTVKFLKICLSHGLKQETFFFTSQDTLIIIKSRCVLNIL